MGYQLGIGIGFFVALVASLPFLIISRSRRNHDRRHQRHTELMCRDCHFRYYSPNLSHGEAIRRWPRRIHGQRPPQGTG